MNCKIIAKASHNEPRRSSRPVIARSPSHGNGALVCGRASFCQPRTAHQDRASCLFISGQKCCTADKSFAPSPALWPLRESLSKYAGIAWSNSAVVVRTKPWRTAQRPTHEPRHATVRGRRATIRGAGLPSTSAPFLRWVTLPWCDRQPPLRTCSKPARLRGPNGAQEMTM